MIGQVPLQRNHGTRDVRDLADRLDRVSLIVKEESGQLDRRTATATERLLRRAGQRLRLSGEHTVVALVGGTGSGKSSLFNALAGLTLSPVGIRRPTTAAPYACVWGAHNVAGLLDWLGVPEGRRIGRESELDADAEVALRGLVLLDLPDHDSVELEHQLEVDRLIDLVDVLVWVLDPQKYADTVMHERYLRPLRTYSDVMMVVLNQADRLDPGQAQSCLQDLRRMLNDDGLGGVRTMLTSARSGVGLGDLRTVITAAVASRQATARRISADLEAVSLHLGQLVRPEVDPAVVDAVTAPTIARLAELAGVDKVAAAGAAEYRGRSLRRTGWPLAAWRPRRDEVAPRLAVERAGVAEVARRAAASATEGMPQGWQERIEQVAAESAVPLADELDAAAHQEVATAIPAAPWWRAAAVANVLLLLTAAVSATWAGASALGADLGSRAVQIGVPVAAGALLIALLCGAAFARTVGRQADVLQQQIGARLRAEVGRSTEALLLNALRAELAIYNTLQQTLGSFASEKSAGPGSTS